MLNAIALKQCASSIIVLINMRIKKLFRQEVLLQKKYQNYGSVFINLPKHYTFLAVIFGFLVICGFLFLFFMTFTEKTIARGFLNATKGLVHIYPKKNGVITRTFIKQGVSVQKGDPLFFIETSLEDKMVQEKMLSQFKQRKNAVQKAISYKKRELLLLKSLLSKNYIAQRDYHRQEEALVSLESDFLRIEAELMDYKKEKAYWIQAPVPGVITNLAYHLGQYVQIDKPLVTIVPDDAKFQAEILVPVQQIGLIKKNDRVVIHYDAYPYAHFGSFFATITMINQSPSMDSAEEIAPKLGQPYYKVIATLDKQTITFHQQEKKVQQGLTFSAIILGAQKTLAEWIFDPLLQFKGRIFL